MGVAAASPLARLGMALFIFHSEKEHNTIDTEGWISDGPGTKGKEQREEEPRALLEIR